VSVFFDNRGRRGTTAKAQEMKLIWHINDPVTSNSTKWVVFVFRSCCTHFVDMLMEQAFSIIEGGAGAVVLKYNTCKR